MSGISTMFIAKILAASLVVAGLGDTFGFSPNCTIPPEGANFVSGPNARGTLSILWNCLSIIFLCSWNILHLNVPAPQPWPSGFFQTIWRAILDSRKKLKWMLIAILVPEFLVGKGINDWLAAKDGVSIIQKYATEDAVEWEIIHGYLCDMGGFAVDFSELLGPSGLPSTTGELGGYMDPSVAINLSRMKHKIWALSGRQMAYARQENIITRLPNVPAIDLKRLSKGDSLVKFFAIIQVSWLIIQSIVRWAKSLSISQLEVATLAFSASSLVIYILFWNKPQGIETIMIVAAARLPDREEMVNLAVRGQGYFWTRSRFAGVVRGDTGDVDLVPIPNDAAQLRFHILTPPERVASERSADGRPPNGIVLPRVSLLLPLGAAFGGAIFGALHCLAWNFHFPTPVERLLWRLCSVLMTALPILFIPLAALWREQNSVSSRRRRPWRKATACAIALFIALPYLLARLIILVEVFRDLFFLPPDAFRETWSGTVPHWG
ncbi:MAG: hypothetical protein M1839_005199 [Geoglossum umbratile]|nr:MAG: hypothetical protein M1839_005199 [Geoglossum umbratile]